MGAQSSMSELKPDRELYRENYRGIDIEVSRAWGGPSSLFKEVWCFYLNLLVEQFQERYHADLWRPIINLYDGSVVQPCAECLKSLDWHSDMTFYSRNSAPEEPFRSIKAGCDYQHMGDEGRTYTADRVMHDAKRCVDSLLNKFPGLRTADVLWKEYYAPFHAVMKAKEAQKL